MYCLCLELVINSLEATEATVRNTCEKCIRFSIQRHTYTRIYLLTPPRSVQDTQETR